MVNYTIKPTALVVCVALSFIASSAFAAGSHSGGHGASEIGSAGDAGHVDREIVVEMGEMYFSPARLARLAR